MNDWMQKIHRCDIYQDFESQMLEFQTEANNIDPHLESIFGGFNEKTVTIAEVGSWKGSSAISICKYFLAKKIIPTIFCIDTWNGSTYHRQHDEFFAMLKCKNGFPSLYRQFLSNVIHENLQDFVIPVPHSSHDAARYLKKLNISADFVFLDGCHEYFEVLDDCKSYFPLVKNGGILFGDDFLWPWLSNAVIDFAKQNDVSDKIPVFGDIWVIKKT